MMFNTKGSDEGSGDGNGDDISGDGSIGDSGVVEFGCICADGFLGDICDQADSTLSPTRGPTSGAPTAPDGISGDGSGHDDSGEGSGNDISGNDSSGDDGNGDDDTGPTTLPTFYDPCAGNPCRSGGTCVSMMFNTESGDEGSDEGSGDGNGDDISGDGSIGDSGVVEFGCICADGFLGDTCDQADSTLSPTRGPTSGAPTAPDGDDITSVGGSDNFHLAEFHIDDATGTDSRESAHGKAGTPPFRATVVIGTIAVAVVVMATVLHRRRKRHADVELEWFDDIVV